MVVSTGIEKLDKILHGGIPEKFSTLLLGPPKCGKTLFGMQFLSEGLKKNEYGICVLTNNFPEDFVKSFGEFYKIETSLKNGLLRFVDCYSVHVGIEKENTIFILRVNGPSSLSEASIAISELIKKIPPKKIIRTVVDSVSTFLLYNRPNFVAEFIQVINGKLKARGANTLYILEEGMHKEDEIATLTSLLDGVIHLKQIDKQNLLQIKGFGADMETKYIIKDGKFILAE